MIEPLQSLLAPNALEGLTTRPLPELRDLRVQCSQVENDISMARRVAQGRLDIVGHEVRRRSGDEGDAPSDNGLLFDLPDVLAEHSSGAPSGRPVNVAEPGEVALKMVERLDRAASPADLAGVDQLSEQDLRELFERIRGFEVELSAVRRQLHERIDALQSEIGRRYRDGEASIDNLLS